MGFFQALTTWVCYAVDLGNICTRYTQQLPVPNIPSTPAIPKLPATHAPALPLPPLQQHFFCNTPTSRDCWINGPFVWDYYTIDTDYEEHWPRGLLREYWLNITYTTIAPDGVKTIGQVINGTYPGPLIEANWGDRLKIHVTNYLDPKFSPCLLDTAANGTTIHWHGLRQWRSSEADGVNGITQCPIAPGESYTYEFLVQQYGHTWYHSHYSLQYPDGLYGPLVIHGPTSANWDIDVGVVMLSDWIHLNAFVVFSRGELRAEPVMKTAANSTVINGHGIYPCYATDKDPSTNCTGHPGSRYETVFQKGKKYLLRIVNTSADMQFRFAIDNHILQVVEADFVPVKQFNVTFITVGIGQRYTIIVHALPNSTYPFPRAPEDSNFWIRTIPLDGCGDLATSIWPTYGILRYNTYSISDPVSKPFNNTFYLERPPCADVDAQLLKPVLRWDIGNPWDQENFTVALTDPDDRPHGFRRWEIGNVPMWLDWANPAMINLDNRTWNEEYDVVVENTGIVAVQWVYFLILGNFSHITHPRRRWIPTAHPIHLHGHDFAILAQGSENWDTLDPKPKLSLSNPARRDVALLNKNGYLVIAFRTDNPGVWLLHCHIAWHASSGLALQVIERQSEIKRTIVREKQLHDTCQKWKDFRAKVVVQQDDSGV